MGEDNKLRTSAQLSKLWDNGTIKRIRASGAKSYRGEDYHFT
jgi:hypothetical protein